MAEVVKSYRVEPPELVGGALCLDFLNTVSWRGDPVDCGERLTSFGEFAAWCSAAGAVDKDQADTLASAGSAEPQRAAKTLADAINLREALARIFAYRSQAASVEVATVNRILHEASAMPTLRIGSTGFECTAGESAAPLRSPLQRIAWSAVEVLTTSRLDQVRQCTDPRCGWFFLDTSKSGRRRWCDMKACGNRAKVRNFYRRRAAERENR
jgi:predicted RNA-binding Zn ribbon-like protein